MKIILLLVMVGICSSAASQSNLAFKTKMNTGVGVQKGKLRNVYGIGAMFETPVKKLSHLKFFASLDLGVNGLKKQPYELDFNGVITNTNVHYTSNVIHVSTGLKYVFMETRRWSPYTAISLGSLNYYTSMSIEDPDDPDGCTPMETKPVSYSMVFAGTAEAGVRIATKQHRKGSGSFIEAGAGYIAGTKGKYLRLERKDKHDHSLDNYMVKFQNNTGEIHEHSLGTKYQTISSQLVFHLAYVWPL